MRIRKSTRHSRITGDFGESLVLYWLSKSGFECARVDHTGIDLIARRPDSREIMGISVKSRSRNQGKEGTSLNVLKPDIEKARKASDAFGCRPYFAFVVDAGGVIRVFILSVPDLLRIRPGGKKVSAWSMSDAQLQRYRDNRRVMWFELAARDGRWW
jgi:Holliday junction resolvase-like predicted endonuclease